MTAWLASCSGIWEDREKSRRARAARPRNHRRTRDLGRSFPSLLISPDGQSVRVRIIGSPEEGGAQIAKSVRRRGRCMPRVGYATSAQAHPKQVRAGEPEERLWLQS